MTKRFGTYTVKLDVNSNLITVTNKSEMIWGKAYTAQNSGSAFTNICNQVEIKTSNKNG